LNGQARAISQRMVAAGNGVLVERPAKRDPMGSSPAVPTTIDGSISTAAGQPTALINHFADVIITEPCRFPGGRSSVDVAQ